LYNIRFVSFGGGVCLIQDNVQQFANIEPQFTAFEFEQNTNAHLACNSLIFLQLMDKFDVQKFLIAAVKNAR